MHIHGKRVLLSAAVIVTAIVVPTSMSAPLSAEPSDAPAPTASVRQSVERKVPELTWERCGDLPLEYVGQPFTCATALVPLDHDDPTGPTIEIALAKYAASDPSRKIGTVFLNPGGPGGSGVDLAYAIGQDLDQRLRGRFDVVGFDPRGVARSTPIRCFPTTDIVVDFSWATTAFPYTPELERPFFAHWNTFRARCSAGIDTVIEHMSTTDVVRDLDLLRRAVGDRKLTYLGFSYGTFIGQVYANLFPRRIRAIAIDGVVDPVRYSEARHVEIDQYGGQKVMDELLRLCDEAAKTDPSSCPLSRGKGGAEARWSELLDLLEAAPLDLEDGGPPLDYALLVSATLGYLYDPASWREWVEITDGLLRFANGETDPATVASSVRQLKNAGSSNDGGLRSRDDYPNYFDAYYGNLCADSEWPTSFKDWSQQGRETLAISPFGAPWWWQSVPCASWPADADRYLGPWTPRTRTPILIVGNEFDPATAIEGAKVASELIRRDRLVTYEGYGHVAYGTSACATNRIARYLRTATLPSRARSTCPAPENPFVAVEGRSNSVRGALMTVLRPPIGR